MNRHCSTTGLRQQGQRDDQDQRPKQSKSSVEHSAPRLRKSTHSLHVDACDLSSCLGETAHQSPCGPRGCECRRERRFAALDGLVGNPKVIGWWRGHRRCTHHHSSWRLINPRPSLAPPFRSRASVQPHARPLVSLRPADRLLNTAESGHEKQISSRGHASPG